MTRCREASGSFYPAIEVIFLTFFRESCIGRVNPAQGLSR
jgi:hypothetical protein